jgi:hypothetical protein
VSAPTGPEAPPRVRALHTLAARWHEQARGPRSVYHLPLSALLLHGLTYDADSPPALDILLGVLATVEGWLEAAGDATGATEEPILRVPKLEAMMLSRRVAVALELLRREGEGEDPR